MSPNLLESNDETYFFEVESESRPGVKFQVMHDVDHHWIYTCEQYYYRKVFCKHMAVCAELAGIKDNRVYAEVRT